ncbi:MAG: hypothetical protein KF788_03680 [Piscinibacter sp.]|nr:hypothetical protein [Piscinibacter sp.]
MTASPRSVPLHLGIASLWAAGRALATLPFDVLRAQHASAVRAGLARNSMLESRDFERAVTALERTLLGPLARRV